jgi:hypothetical protein
MVFPASLSTPTIARRDERDEMGCKCWIAGLTVCVGVTGWEPAAAQTPACFAGQVFLQDDAGVPADLLEQAKHAATRVFALSNIDLQWIGQGPYQPCSLTVRIVAKPTGAKNRSGFVVGIAPGTRAARGIVAFAFYDRIQLYSAELGLDASQMPGHVMAHELGHLLLPHGAHSTSGVMRGAWDGNQANQAITGLLTFTPAEAALIRERLSACASRIAPE